MKTSANPIKTAAGWDNALLDSLFREPMSDCLRMLILRDMALIADDSGRAPLSTLGQRFRNFFLKRRNEGKQEERSEVLLQSPVNGTAMNDTPMNARADSHSASAQSAIESGALLSDRSLDWWQKSIADYATAEVADFVFRDDDHLVFRPELWQRWTPAFRKALRNIAETRLIEYFDTRVEGSW